MNQGLYDLPHAERARTVHIPTYLGIDGNRNYIFQSNAATQTISYDPLVN